jgi:hypothetical protein
MLPLGIGYTGDMIGERDEAERHHMSWIPRSELPRGLRPDVSQEAASALVDGGLWIQGLLVTTVGFRESRDWCRCVKTFKF